MKNTSVLKPDKQGRITLPNALRDAELVSYQINTDGSVLFFPVQAVRYYPDMSDLPETDEVPEQMKKSLERSLRSKELGVYATSASEAIKKYKKKTTK